MKRRNFLQALVAAPVVALVGCKTVTFEEVPAKNYLRPVSELNGKPYNGTIFIGDELFEESQFYGGVTWKEMYAEGYLRATDGWIKRL